MTVTRFAPLALLALLGNGCAALLVGAGAAAGAGAVAYVRGELKATEEASLDRAWNAARQAMDDLRFNVTRTEKGTVSASVTARTSSDEKVVVKLRSQTDAVTEVRIRVGVFGDEGLSHKVLESIRKRL